MMHRLVAPIIFAFALFLPALAEAREEILSFDSDVVVDADGDIIVTETIKVRAQGNQIRRGIFRDIPVKSADRWGFWSKSGFKLLGVRRNGADSPHHTESQGRFIRIYIGESGRFIDHGIHTYAITYRMRDMLRFFDGYDELYWNVTGNFWSFPILEATTRIHLPNGAVAQQMAGYTGGYGDSGADYTASGIGTNTPSFALTRPLAPQQGLTVAVGFTKGVVAPPALSGLSWFFDNLGAWLFLGGWFAVAAYFTYAWFRVGRDPDGETVIPLYHPPKDLSPAMLSYLRFKGFRNLKNGASFAFIAALLSLGVKKLLKIEDQPGGDVTFLRLYGDEATMGTGERALYRTFFGARDQFTLKKSNGTLLVLARSALRRAIMGEAKDKFFRYNLVWFIAGAIAAILITVLALVLQQPTDEAIGAIIGAFMFSIPGWLLVHIGFRKLVVAYPIGWERVIGFIMLVAGCLTLLVGLAFTMIATYPIYRFAAVMLMMGVGAVMWMFYLMQAPTVLGAKLFSQIEGFMLYLTTAETNRLNLRDAPEMSEELYERYLPYAVGLGVEKPWSEAFSAHLARVDPATTQSYQPAWYNGSHWSGDSIGAATGAAVAAVSQSMADAMPAPKSSSGSGGGGFSGGGGGGGGGGGW